MAEVKNPHDALFKRTFSRLEEARTLLKSALPRPIARRVDWASLALEPGSFVDDRLKDRHSDLLFSVRIGGQEALVYLLLEHQSSTDRWMPLRLVRYQVRIWERWLDDHPEATRLPVIVPLVLHHDETRWSGATELAELFEVEPGLRPALFPYLLRQRCLVDEISGITDAELEARALTLFAELTVRALARMRTLSEAEAEAELWRWLELARALARTPHGLPKLSALLQYLIEVSQVPEVVLRRFAAAIGPPVEEYTVPTIAEKWMSEGIEQGIEQGRVELLLRLLRLKFEALPADREAQVRAAGAGDVDRWSARLLTASTLDEVFTEAG